MIHQYKISYMLSIDGLKGTKESYYYSEAETREDAIDAFIDFTEQCLIDDGIEFAYDGYSITTSQTFPDGSKHVQVYYDFDAEKEN